MHSRFFPRFVITAIVLAAAPSHARAWTFTCGGGDAACLINDIRTSNAFGGSNSIVLGAGTYHLTAVNNISTEGPNGLPVITSNLLIQGAGMSATIIQRDSGAPEFRVLEVAGTGTLSLKSLTIQGNDYIQNLSGLFHFGGLGLLNIGLASLTDVAVRGHAGVVSGGGTLNTGNLSLTRTLVEENQGDYLSGGGIFNLGTMQINRSTIRNNRGNWTWGGGIATGPNPAVITASTISGNGVNGNGGGIDTSGGLTIKNSTIQGNGASGTDAGGGGLYADSGTTVIESCTITDNGAGWVGTGGGIFTRGSGVVQMRNTILARNEMSTADVPPWVPQDCYGSVVSLGHNIVGTLDGCSFGLISTDYVGDAKLGTFTDQIKAADGSIQGNGQIPLLAGSPAIDAGDYNACSTKDQLGYPRVDANLDCGQTCDIGAVEYAPVVNPWVGPVLTTTQRNTTPLPGYPAGTLTVTKTYKNNVLNIAWPVFVLTSLSSNAVLLNGDPPNAGGVGARLTPNVGSDSVWSPGETIGVTWTFGLKSGSFAPFTADAVGFPDYP